jgi:hypothetical protein
MSLAAPLITELDAGRLHDLERLLRVTAAATVLHRASALALPCSDLALTFLFGVTTAAAAPSSSSSQPAASHLMGGCGLLG